MMVYAFAAPVYINNTDDDELAIVNSKLDKLYQLLYNYQKEFKWENSMLTEMAQTQSYVLKNIRGQERRIRRLNRNLKATLRSNGLELVTPTPSRTTLMLREMMKRRYCKFKMC